MTQPGYQPKDDGKPKHPPDCGSSVMPPAETTRSIEQLAARVAALEFAIATLEAALVVVETKVPTIP